MMTKLEQIKRIIFIVLLISLLSSCGNSNNIKTECLVSERKLEEFLKRNDQTFIEVVEFLATEKNSSDLIVTYKADNESDYKRYEVALVNLRKSYFEKAESVYYTFHIYEAKSLDDFSFISD